MTQWKTRLLVPSDNLLRDCTILTPPEREAFMRANEEEQVAMLSRAWIEQTGELRKCDNKVQSIQEWKQKAIQLQDKYDEVIEVNP